MNYRSLLPKLPRPIRLSDDEQRRRSEGRCHHGLRTDFGRDQGAFGVPEARCTSQITQTTEDKTMQNQPKIGDFTTDAPLVLRATPNGGWLVSQQVWCADCPTMLGAYSTVEEMLDALTSALVVDQSAETPLSPDAPKG